MECSPEMMVARMLACVKLPREMEDSACQISDPDFHSSSTDE
jgi:hypothetical protein